MTFAKLITASAIAFGCCAALVTVGCSQSAEERDMQRIWAHPGEDAANVAAARAENARDEMRLIEETKIEYERRRAGLVKEARFYHDKSAAVWSDRVIPDRQKSLYANDYLRIAGDRERQADRYTTLITGCNTRLGYLAGESENQDRKAVEYEDITALQPEIR